MAGLAGRALGVRGLDDAVERPLIHVIEAVESADRVRIRERARLLSGCRTRHSRSPWRTSYLTRQS